MRGRGRERERVRETDRQRGRVREREIRRAFGRKAHQQAAERDRIVLGAVEATALRVEDL